MLKKSGARDELADLIAELHYRAADLRLLHPRAAEILREAAGDLEACVAGQGSAVAALPTEIQMFVQRALSSTH